MPALSTGRTVVKTVKWKNGSKPVRLPGFRKVSLHKSEFNPSRNHDDRITPISAWFMSSFGYMLPLEAVVLVGSVKRYVRATKEGFAERWSSRN